MPNFTLEQLKEKVIKLANQNPNFVYKPPDGVSTCYYLRGDNCSGCIFGQAIISLNPSMREFLEQADEKKNSISWILDNLFTYSVTTRLLNWCTRVQNKQDAGYSWKFAVEKANESMG